MGEYVKSGNDVVNIGTLENIYYATYEDMKTRMPHLSLVPGNLNPRDYLKPDNGYRFRFPFFGERGYIGNYDKPERGFLIKIPRNLIPECGDWLYHDKYINYVAEPLRFNSFHLCPAEPARDYQVASYDNIDDYFIFEIVQQKVVGQELQTIVRCPFCKAKTRLLKELIELIADVILDHGNTWADEETKENIRIALRGYTDFEPLSE